MRRRRETDPQELLLRLRGGVSGWNEWRREHPEIPVDLSDQDIAHFGNIDTDLHHLAGPRQQPSVFQRFRTLQVAGVDFSGCRLSRARFREIHLPGADFRGADLRGARFVMAQLEGADLSGADLRGADFHLCSADRVTWSGARLADTRFGFCSLRRPADLESTTIEGPCHVDSFTIAASRSLPRPFLERCGVPAVLIQLARRLESGPSFRTSFLSFSTRDAPFIERLRGRMLALGAPCWYAHEDLRQPTRWLEDHLIQKELFRYVDAAGGLVVALSPASSESSWVEIEVERGLSEQSRRGPGFSLLTLLLAAPGPAARPWVAKLGRHPVVDFRGWQDPRVFERAFEKLAGFLRRSLEPDR